MTKELSAAKFIALLSLRVDLGKPRRIPDPLPKAKEKRSSPVGMTFYAALAVLLEQRARRVARFAMRGRRH
jgi:hypothetical protein